MTIEEARALREEAEREIVAILQKLQTTTGLDVAAVDAMIHVAATMGGDPRRVITAVRIDLTV